MHGGAILRQSRLMLTAAGMLVLLGLPAAPAVGQQPVKYRGVTILSLIGDEIGVITRQPPTDSRLDRNRRDSMRMPRSALDDVALLTLRTSLGEAVAGLRIDMLAANDPVMYRAQLGLLDRSDARIAAIREAIRARISASGSSHLLLLTKHRAEARLRHTAGTIGDGFLEGLGFYLDYDAITASAESGALGVGWLGPYAYVRLSLVDAATFEVVRSETATASATFSAARSESRGDPWEALSAQAKLDVLRALLERELVRLLPKLLQ